MGNSRGSAEEDGGSINFQIWNELKALRVDREAANEDRARERQDRDPDRALGLAHMQLATEDAPRGATLRVQGQGMTHALTEHDMQVRVARATANGAAAHAYFAKTRCALDSGGTNTT